MDVVEEVVGFLEKAEMPCRQTVKLSVSTFFIFFNLGFSETISFLISFRIFSYKQGMAPLKNLNWVGNHLKYQI